MTTRPEDNRWTMAGPSTIGSVQPAMATRALEHVIVVDDDEAIRDSLGLLLGAEGYKVTLLSSGKELLDQMSQLPLACVLLDIRMPEINGLDVLQTIVAQAPQLVAIMITGHGDVPLAVRTLQKGAVDFIEKPFDPERILQAIRNAGEIALKRHQRLLAREQANAILGRLSDREQEILDRIALGRPSKAIANELGISVRTVEAHRRHIMQKTQAASTAELVHVLLATKD